MLEKFSLKYTDNVPKNYDISKIHLTFDFIYLVLKRGASINGAIEGVAGKYNLSESDLLDYFIENKYILNNANVNEILKQMKKYNTKSLKRILKKHGFKTSGKREKIEKRIIDNNLFKTDYYLSSKSKIFYKNKKRRIYIFNDYLFKNYYFTEFNDFYMDNYRKTEAKIPIEFIKLHINKSIEDKNHDNYIANNQIMANYFLFKENYKEMLEYVLKIFCMNLNPIWKVNNLKNHTGISKDVFDNLLFLQGELGKNRIINTYYLIWDSFDFNRIIVSKYEGYRCLKDILNSKNYHYINSNLNKKFYSNDDLKIKKITQKTLFDF